jgi:hypothetical protein
MDIKRKQKSHCVNGHEYTEQTVYHDTRGKRQCRICRAAGVRKWYDVKGREQQGRVKKVPRIERLQQLYQIDDAGCWTWTGAINEDGYGIFCKRTAHRYSYTQFKGPIPKGLEIDHLCSNRKCINPAHLEAVTHKENIQRSWSRGKCEHFKNRLGEIKKAKTHCPQGHPYSGENLTIDKSSNARRCIICEQAKFKRYQEKQKAKRFIE